MELTDLRKMIEGGIPSREVTVFGEACNLSVVVVSEAFESLSPAKRQKLVPDTVAGPLSSGALHAISMKVYTPTEWAQLKTT